MDNEARILLLFIDGADKKNVRAAKKIVDFLGEEVRLQVVDVNDDPDLAEVIGISETPTLIRLSPDPRRRVVGDISNTEDVATYLGKPWKPGELQYTE